MTEQKESQDTRQPINNHNNSQNSSDNETLRFGE